MNRSLPDTQKVCPRCNGSRVGAEVTDAFIQRLGGRPVASFLAVVCTACGFSEFYVTPGDLPKLLEAVQQYPAVFDYKN